MLGSAPETFTVVRSVASSSVTFTVTGGPSRTFATRLSHRGPACVTINVYLSGPRQKNRHTPSRRVFVD